tara:strand:+ start:7079 stop:7255 length:177 start_codon:yes stop_codon:yes gene_type:complete
MSTECLGCLENGDTMQVGNGGAAPLGKSNPLKMIWDTKGLWLPWLMVIIVLILIFRKK